MVFKPTQTTNLSKLQSHTIETKPKYVFFVAKMNIKIDSFVVKKSSLYPQKNPHHHLQFQYEY